MKLFEVRKDGKLYMSTEYKECIPEERILKSMKSAGYKPYINGKLWKEKNKENKNG